MIQLMPPKKDNEPKARGPGRPPLPVPRVPVSARLPADLVERLEAIGKWRERGRAELVFFAVRDYVSREYDKAKAEGAKKEAR